VRTPFRRALDLPPPYRPVTLREAGDAFAHAVAIAADAGAGTLVHVGRFDLAEFAVVLEPDEPLATARRAFYAGMVALGGALAAHAPPEKPVHFDWPDTIRVDGGIVGGGRLGWPAGAREDEPPAWLVFGAMIRTVSMGEYAPGLVPLGTALENEGFGSDSGGIAESFARHLMLAADTWRERGFEAIADAYLARLPEAPGSVRRLDQHGNYLVHSLAEPKARRCALAEQLRVPAWLDPSTRAPLA
jgi:hypothetical protein